MVKGISKQVILVNPSETDLFEQAIFILKDTKGITDEMLLQEAKRMIGSPKRKPLHYGPVWAVGGALLTAVAWLFTILL